MTLEALREHWRAAFVPEGAVLGVAGCFAWDDLRERVEDLLDDWRGARPDPVDAQPAPRGYALRWPLPMPGLRCWFWSGPRRRSVPRPCRPG